MLAWTRPALRAAQRSGFEITGYAMAVRHQWTAPLATMAQRSGFEITGYAMVQK